MTAAVVHLASDSLATDGGYLAIADMAWDCPFQPTEPSGRSTNGKRHRPADPTAAVLEAKFPALGRRR